MTAAAIALNAGAAVFYVIAAVCFVAAGELRGQPSHTHARGLGFALLAIGWTLQVIA